MFLHVVPGIPSFMYSKKLYIYIHRVTEKLKYMYAYIYILMDMHMCRYIDVFVEKCVCIISSRVAISM